MFDTPCRVVQAGLAGNLSVQGAVGHAVVLRVVLHSMGEHEVVRVPPDNLISAAEQQTRPRRDAKERIFAAAERLFTGQGYAATSMRMIAAEAGVPLASINYHFKSKRDLMEAVYQRVLGADGRRSSYLDKLEQEAGGAPLSVTRIVETFIESTLRLSRKDNVSGAVFKQLIGRAYFEPGDDFIPDEYVQIMDRYRGALMRALPDLGEDEVMRRMYYFIGIVAYVMAGRDVMHLLGRCAPADANDPERLLRALVPFIVGGMQAPAPR